MCSKASSSMSVVIQSGTFTPAQLDSIKETTKPEVKPVLLHIKPLFVTTVSPVAVISS